MKKFILTAIISCFTLSCFGTEIQEKTKKEEIITFALPKGWKKADPEKLSPAVKLMLVGTGEGNFPPSLTLVVEPFSGTLKDYLKIVKNINIAEKTEWKNLGKIPTKAGNASLSQFDETSSWGTARTMTAILVKNENAYILSATALKSEFSKFYKDFFKAMRSLDIQ